MRQHTHLPFQGKSSVKQTMMQITLLFVLTMIFSACSQRAQTRELTPITIALVPTEINAVNVIR